MFACGTGSMRGPQAKTPLLLLLLLLLLTTLTGTVLSQDYGEDADAGTDADADADPDAGDHTEIPDIISTVPAATEAPDDPVDDERGSGMVRSHPVNEEYAESAETTVDPDVTNPIAEPGEVDIVFILIPVVLVVVVIAMIGCCIFICQRWRRNQAMKKEDPYLDGSSVEKVPMPMFEEDVPSVLELEMEELGQWMKKDSEAAEDTVHA